MLSLDLFFGPHCSFMNHGIPLKLTTNHCSSKMTAFKAVHPIQQYIRVLECMSKPVVLFKN